MKKRPSQTLSRIGSVSHCCLGIKDCLVCRSESAIRAGNDGSTCTSAATVARLSIPPSKANSIYALVTADGIIASSCRKVPCLRPDRLHHPRPKMSHWNCVCVS